MVVPDLPEGNIWERLVSLYRVVADAVSEAEETPLVVSGDCTVSLGVLAGVQRRGVDPSIIWFDAHGDVHTLESSTSGYIGGMALRLALGAHADRMVEPLGLRPLTERQATLVDARDLDPAESEFLSTAAIRRCSVEQIHLPEDPIVLHVDVDVIDGDEVPGLRYPVPGGPPRNTVLDAIQRIVDTGRVVALDIACPWYAGNYPQRSELLAAITGRFELH